MPTAVHGETHLLAHCIFKWQEDMAGRRLYVIEPAHCLRCLVELRRVSPLSRLSWMDGAGVPGGPRKLGGHCTFHAEDAPDVRQRGAPVRIYWIDTIHCPSCADLAQHIFSGEPGLVLVDRRFGKVAPRISRS